MPSSYPFAAPNRGHIVLYADADCGGESTSLFDDVISLYFLGWNDRISSIVVVSGSWQCYKDSAYYSPMGPVLTPGIYNRVAQFGIDNDSITSLRCVG